MKLMRKIKVAVFIVCVGCHHLGIAISDCLSGKLLLGVPKTQYLQTYMLIK